jgi:hypothetical protein
MMEKIQFDELNNLRKLYRKKKTQKLEKQRALRECTKQKTRTLNKLRQDLKYKRSQMLKDKKMRTEAGLSNQKDWQLEIEHQTQSDEDLISSKENEYDINIIKFETSIEDLNLEISDLYWELTIKLEYYKESQTITNTENLVISSTGK